MCKLFIFLGVCVLFSGCSTAKPSLSKHSTSKYQKKYQPIIAQSKFKGCRALSNGYLVCPKIARR